MKLEYKCERGKGFSGKSVWRLTGEARHESEQGGSRGGLAKPSV